MKFCPSPLFIETNDLGRQLEVVMSDKHTNPMPMWLAYNGRTVIDYCDNKSVLTRDEYYCHGRMGHFLAVQMNDQRREERTAWAITHVTRRTQDVPLKKYIIEWHRFIFDEQASPWRSILPAFIPIWAPEGYLRAVVLRDPGQSAKKIVNFLIACRFPTFQNDAIKPYAIARRWGADPTVAMMASQLVVTRKEHGQWIYEPAWSRDNRFWWPTVSARAFHEGRMTDSRTPLIITYKKHPGVFSYTSGVPNISVWNDRSELFKFGHHYPPNGDYQATPALMKAVVTALTDTVKTGTHAVDFKSVYLKRKRNNTWDNL